MVSLTELKGMDMKRDQIIKLPEECKTVFICLGWEHDKEFDVDASVVGLNGEKEEECKVFYTSTTAKGLKHMGDDREGSETKLGDREMIKVNFQKLSKEVVELYVTLHIFSEKFTFKNVKDAYVRVCVAEGENKEAKPGIEIAKYPIDIICKSQALIFARLVK